MFPEGVAFPVGGRGAREYIVIEMHYDNPLLHSGTCGAKNISKNVIITCLSNPW